MTDERYTGPEIAPLRIMAQAADQLRAQGVHGVHTWRTLLDAWIHLTAHDLGEWSSQRRIEIEAARDELDTLLGCWHEPPTPAPRFQVLFFPAPDTPSR